MKRAYPVRRHAYALGFIGAACSIVVAIAFRADLLYLYERAHLYVAPSGERAYDYGARHFNAIEPSVYNINRAEYFFNYAAARSPNLLGVFHELARISFLRGRYNEALHRINFHISMHGAALPNSFYVRGLIEGYMGRFDAAAADYEAYLASDPTNWAAINDYGWVLLKVGRTKEAEAALARGLVLWPENPWLLNTHGIALYEEGQFEAALISMRRAAHVVGVVSEGDWLRAYPGNDPAVASLGVATLRASIADNMHMIAVAASKNTVQLQQ